MREGRSRINSAVCVTAAVLAGLVSFFLIPGPQAADAAANCTSGTSTSFSVVFQIDGNLRACWNVDGYGNPTTHFHGTVSANPNSWPVLRKKQNIVRTCPQVNPPRCSTWWYAGQQGNWYSAALTNRFTPPA